MRPPHADPADYPGTRGRRANDLCHTCYVADWREKNRPTECTDCGVKVRPQKASEADYPGTARYGAKGMCKSCYNRFHWQRRQETPPKRPKFCKSCKREVYSSRQKKPHADAIQYGAHGMCQTCYQHSIGRRKRSIREVNRNVPKECVGCGSPMRPGGTSEDKHPGTRAHNAKGLCSSCYSANWKKKHQQADAPEQLAPVVDPGLARLMRERREREARRKRAAQILANQGRRPAA